MKEEDDDEMEDVEEGDEQRVQHRDEEYDLDKSFRDYVRRYEPYIVAA